MVFSGLAFAKQQVNLSSSGNRPHFRVSNVTPAANPPAASPQVKVAVPVADDVWKRGDKYARGAVATEELRRSWSGRRPPRRSAGEGPHRVAGREAALAGDRYDRGAGCRVSAGSASRHQRVPLLGAICERWIRQQLAEGTALDRATAVEKIREQLAEARLEKKEARVNLFVRCHWVAVLFGAWRNNSQDAAQRRTNFPFRPCVFSRS